LSDVYARRGFIDLMAKNYDSAMQNFQKKIELDPKSPTSYINLANAQIQMGKKTEALANFRKATQIAPNSLQAWMSLGQGLAADSAAAAAKAFDRALAIDPKSAGAMRGKGLTLLLQEQCAAAISPLEGATQADPNDADSWVYLGQAYLGVGKQTEARAALNRALKIDPAHEQAQQVLQQMTAGAK
jgi:tetratricopeptide (TPR) repeat protein